MGESFIFMLMLALGGGNGGDLLDFASTDVYWQTREQRVVDIQTMSGILADEDATAADRLMAIRALGELGKAADTDPADKAGVLEKLTPLVASKEPFVGQYAKRSIAWVKGEDPATPTAVTNEKLDADLAILPHTSQIVGQMRMTNGVGPIDWTKLLPDFKEEHGLNRAEMIAQVSSGVAEVAGMIGNARLDSVTVGGQFFGDGDDGYAVIVARGQYDRVAVQIAMQDMAEENDDDTMSFYSIGDIEVIVDKSEWSSFAMLMPSDEVIILMFGESDRGFKMFPIDETADLLKNGDAQMAFNQTVTKQIKQVDREKAVAWVAMQIPMPLRNEVEEVFGPFEAGHAMAVRDAQGDFDISWAAEGGDAEAIAKAVEVMNEGIAEGRAELREEMQRNPEMKMMFEPMVKTLETLTIEAQGKTMTGGMKVPGDIGGMMPMMWLGAAAPRHDNAGFAEEAVLEVEIEDAIEDAAEEVGEAAE